MKRALFFLCFLCVSLLLYAQEPVRFGDRDVYLEANVRTKVRGHKTSSLELGTPTGERLNVLVQFESAKIAFEVLKQKGIELGDYLGSNAYYAQVAPGSRPSDFVGTGLRTIVPIRGEWKVVHSLLQGFTPEWAVEGKNLKVDLVWFKGVDAELVKADLHKRGLSLNSVSDLLCTAEVMATREQIIALAEAEYVAAIRWPMPPMSLENHRGARLSGAANLRLSHELGGRGLTGKGVRIGVWDGNVAEHVDFGNRVHCEEFEMSLASSGGHGMHTTGTIIGAGILDERARGMAPDAEAWTWNFNRQSNGLSVGREMLMTLQEHNISLTSNSYGLQVSRLCNFEFILNYTALGNQHLDILSYYFPTLTHVFSAGNDQGACKWAFGHMSNYAKNIITVAALTPGGQMTDFSSFGPLRDGRTAPIIAARGEAVYSVMPEQNYSYLSGTSMSCPTVTGHLALLTQRWGQLHGGALPFNYYLKALIANTADDAGNVGPDYKFGFGVLNSLAAVTAMENNWHAFKSFTRGTTGVQEEKITVPEGVKELRVMLCWNDPVANREYATGQSPIINDLDLTVKQGSNTYYPYSLDPKEPTKPAVANTKNGRDNIEQVVVKDPVAGEYTITVGGKVYQEVQDYVVVWYFDHQRPAITSPMEGDTYAPADEIFLHTENLAPQLKVELSTDGGISYSVLKADASLCDSIAIPPSTPSTDKALLRVTDAKGIVLQSGQFAIMGQVKGLTLAGKSCTSNGWKLAWQPTPHAAKYEILRADVNRGTYTLLATTATPVTEYVLDAGDIKLGERNVYAIRAIDANGVKGPRSRGVLAEGAIPQTIQLTDLPYTESFVGYPLRYVESIEGENIGFQLQETPAALGLEKDSHLLVWQALDDAPEWEDPFTKQRDNVATLTTCNLDLSSTANQKLQLRVYYYLSQSRREKGTLLRLLVNNTEVKDVLNRAQIEGDGQEHFATYDLSSYAGQEVTLAFETALANNKDGALIVSYQLYLVNDTKDVSISWVNDPTIEAKAYMQEETVRFKVMNNSTTEQTHIPISVQIDNKAVYTTTIPSLKPFEDQILSFTHNFSSAEAHKFNVVVRTDVEGDSKPENNEQSFVVYNMGDVLLMPEITYVDLGGGVHFPNVPFVTRRLSGKVNFADGRGTLEPYRADEESVLQILPTKPNTLVQVTFKAIDLAEGDILAVFTGDVPDNLLLLSFSDADYQITGSHKEPLTFVSHARDGGLVFAYIGGSGERKEGWLAELQEVELPDRWELSELRATEGDDPLKRKVEVQVKNLLPISFPNVPLYITVDGKMEKVEIPELAANETKTFTIDEQIDITAPRHAEVTAELGRDGNTENNRKQLTLINDPLWEGGGTIEMPATLAIEKLLIVNDNKQITLAPSPYVDYRTSTSISFYTGMKNEFKFTLNHAPLASQTANTAIRLFIDNDDNGTLAEVAPEYYKVDLVTDQKEYTLIVDLAGVANLKLGDHRMRILLANNENYAAFKEKKAIEWGHAVDFTASIKAGESPFMYEMAILGIEGIASGRKGLTSTTPLKVKLKNNGLAPVTTLDVKIEIDKVAPVEKTLSVNLAPRGGEAVVDLEHTADLSAKGEHSIKVSLLKKDKNDSDNETSLDIVRLPEISNTPYSLVFEGIKSEHIDVLPNELGTSIQNDVTIEGWWKTTKPQTCALLNGGDEGLYLGTFKGSSRTPANVLVFYAGKAGFISKESVLTNDKWHHIAVVASQANNKTTAKAYVDGVEVELIGGPQGGFKVSMTTLNQGLEGENLMFRMWNKSCTKEEIKANMAKSVRSTLGDVLPTGCLAEFIYTEGEGHMTAYGDESTATIQTTRPDDKVWKKLEPKLYSSVEVAGQVIPAKITGTTAVVTMPHNFVDFNKVKVKFISEWGKVVVKQGGTTVTSETELNFANPNHELAFDLTLDVFGITTTETVTIKLETDKSPACEMLGLALLKASNAGLKADITLNGAPLPFSLLLEAENASENERLNPSDVVLKVTGISPLATLYKGDVIQAINEDFHVDLTKPLALKVVAENARDTKYYTVRLAMSQEITWENTKLEYNYGVTTNQAFNATASSQLPVTYVSENTDVVVVDSYGNLEAVGVGTTKLFAKQKGNDIFKPAPEKWREVEVKRVPITITVENIVMALGDEIPEFTFKYDKLLFPNTEWQFEAPYVICNQDNSLATMPLAKGTYKIVPKDYSAPYALGNYMVTRVSGTLTVKDAVDAKEVTLSAKDAAGTALSGVALQFEDFSAETGTDGTYKIHLLPGKYAVMATKSGYTTERQLFEVTDEALTINLMLLKKEFTLTYTTDGNGLLQGLSTQKVASGRDGEQVIAVPKDNRYRFKEWSDNHSTDPVRTDLKVTGNVTAKAEFEAFKYKLIYTVSEGGTFTTAETTKHQEVIQGTDGQSVTVAPEANYVFLGWSDGITSLTRTDQKVMRDLNVTARFAKPRLLTWTEDFEFNAANMEMWNFQKPRTGAGWHIIPLATIDKNLTGNALALAPSYEYPEPFYPSLWAASPWLYIGEAAPTDRVVISFDRYLRRYYSVPTATLEYCFEDDIWVKALDIDNNTAGVKTEMFILDAATLATHKRVRFRWVFDGIGIEAYLVIDNVKVTYERPTHAALRYFAGEHGKVQFGKSGVPKNTVEVMVAVGSNPLESVFAKPDEGYELDKWSDGLKTIERLDVKDVTVTALFKPVAKPKHAVHYIAEANGAIHGIDYQVLEMGATTAGVTAVANEGYSFKQWSDGKTEYYRTDVIGEEDVIFTAQFVSNTKYAVTLTKVGEGRLSITGYDVTTLLAVPEGTELTAVATPKTGWKLKSLMAGDKDIKADGKFVVTADVDVKAVFEKETAVCDPVFVNVQVTPNPFADLLRITNVELQNARYELLNAQGIVVRSGKLMGNEQLIETTDLTSGLYLLRLTAASGATKTISVVKN